MDFRSAHRTRADLRRSQFRDLIERTSQCEWPHIRKAKFAWQHPGHAFRLQKHRGSSVVLLVSSRPGFAHSSHERNQISTASCPLAAFNINSFKVSILPQEYTRDSVRRI